MNTTATISAVTRTAAATAATSNRLNAAQAALPPAALSTRLSSLALAAVLTVSLLAGVHGLAANGGAAAQLAQASTARG